MKKTIYIKGTLLKAGLIIVVLVGITSCNNDQKTINNIDAVDKRNEVTLDSTNKAKDAKFVMAAAEINLEEISLGQLAQKNSSMSDVKEMGKMMEDDHTKAWNEVSALAGKKSIKIPVALNDDAQGDYKKLSVKTGADFDMAYCNMMISGHKDAIKMFEKDSAESKDSAIKQFAVTTLPTLHKHLDHAIACKEKCSKM